VRYSNQIKRLPTPSKPPVRFTDKSVPISACWLLETRG